MFSLQALPLEGCQDEAMPVVVGAASRTGTRPSSIDLIPRRDFVESQPEPSLVAN